MGEYTLLSYYLPLTYIKMDCALACITMPPMRILCITVHYCDATVTYHALSSALWCITVHYCHLHNFVKLNFLLCKLT